MGGPRLAGINHFEPRWGTFTHTQHNLKYRSRWSGIRVLLYPCQLADFTNPLDAGSRHDELPDRDECCLYPHELFVGYGHHNLLPTIRIAQLKTAVLEEEDDIEPFPN